MDLVAKDSPTEHGAVASLLVVALMNTLIDAKVLGRPQILALLREARSQASIYAATGNGRGSIRIIDELIVRYSKEDADES